MNPDRLIELWVRFLAGEEMPLAEEQELLDGLHEAPELRDRLLADAELDGGLAALGRCTSDRDPFLQEISDRLAAKRDETRFLQKVESRVAAEAAPSPGGRASRPPTRGWRPRASGPASSLWMFAAATAAVVFILIVLSTVVPSGSRPRGPGSADLRDRVPSARPEPLEEGARYAKAKEARKEAEKRVETLRREESRLDEERQKAAAAPQEDLRAQADAAFRETVRKRMEEEERLRTLREAEEKAKQAVATKVPDPAPPKSPSAPGNSATQAAVAKLERVAGEVYLLAGSGRTAAKAGDGPGAGQGLEIGAGSAAVLVYPDETRVTVGEMTELRDLKIEGGKRFTVARGQVRASVARQPKDQPMVFVTPHAEATVLGTTLRILVDPDPKKGTRLEVDSGRVRLKNSTGKAVEVASGHAAVAALGVELVPRPLPTDDIVLVPRNSRFAGTAWRLVQDPDASTGWALEGAKRDLRPSQHALFTFQAVADKEYAVWIRGRTTATELGRGSHDSLNIEFPTGLLTKPPQTSAVDEEVPKPTTMAFYDGFGIEERSAYWWIGGMEGGGNTPTPVTVRFARSGWQLARLFVREGPIRIDAVWLSATQKTRPEPNAGGPK